MFLLGVAKNLTNDEMVKNMQDQVISMQDKQMSFLNDTIANTNETITIVVTILGVLSAAVITWIGFMQRNAKKKMDEAEVKMNEATQKITHAEALINTANEAMQNLTIYRDELNTYRTDTEQRVQELSLMIDEKMTDLKEVERTATRLAINHRTGTLLSDIEKKLEISNIRIVRMANYEGFDLIKNSPGIKKIREKHDELTILHLHYKNNLEKTPLDEIEGFYGECLELDLQCNKIYEEIEEYTNSLENGNEGTSN